jgi:hypothetical protein
MDADAMQVFLDDETGGVVLVGPVIVMDWRSATATTPIDAAEAACEVAVQRYGAGRHLLYVQRVGESSPVGRATPAVRSAMMEHFARRDEHVLAAAVVIEATGFAASVIRSATASVLLLRPTPIATHVFQELAAGLRWLSSRPGAPSFDVEHTLQAVSHFASPPADRH